MEHTAATSRDGAAEVRSTSSRADTTGRSRGAGTPAPTSSNAAATGRSREQAWINVGGTERWASTVAGAGLLLAGLSRRSRPAASAVAALAGGALLFRGASGHCPVNARIGRNTATEDTRAALGGGRGVQVKESVTIDRPVSELYAFWRTLENLPRFMDHLESVTTTGLDRSHWVAKAPAGMRVEWDAEIINEVQDQMIGWRSLPGSDVTSAGSVNFDAAGPGRGTRITVHLQYEPPAGKLGALFAKLFGEEPSRQIHEDLRRLKRLLEAGEVPATDGLPSDPRSAGSRRRSPRSMKSA
jgi:uncharacterized membrane protein